jgi:hypothetical protein
VLAFLALSLLPFASAAQEVVVDEAAFAAAEVDRLREELLLLARKNAWTGVERTYLAMEALGGGELLGSDHWTGALAAADRGDVGLVTQRLRAALATGEAVPGAREWLSDLGLRYGRVVLEAGDLAPVEAPFAPDERAAVAYAAGRLAEEGRFEGWLPAGRYLVDGDRVEVRPARGGAR